MRTLEDTARRADSLVAGLLPQQERLSVERDEAASLHGACLEDCASLPDLAALHDAAGRAAGEAQAGEHALTAARHALAGAEQALADAARAFALLDRQDGEARMALTAAELGLAGGQAAHAREAAAQAAALAAQAALADPAALAEAAAAARQTLAACRARAGERAEQLGALAAALSEAQASLPAVEHELAAWASRHQEAARRRAALVQREAEAAQACGGWAEAPRALAARAEALGALAGDAEAVHAAAADALRGAEARAGDASRALRQAETAQSDCREAQARGEGRAEAARTAIAAVLARAVERPGGDASLPEVTLDGGGEAEEERARRKSERLSRERDEMGPVNLRADIELGEIEARLTTLDADRDELTTAIAKLRGSIGHLNREGRERLREVFARVDAQFRTLFTRMMGGGRAHLALVGSDDPLEAGLEIYAEPPGKKLSALSLLSGGEQALTALSLIFAVFSCTPAPVAVLDEVDAPLDDVNVERFCGLLEDVVRDTGTRFLVVTHHQLTMSRMDRLYGVTMQERGVSRLLSVDLQRAAAMVEPVMQAAE